MPRQKILLPHNFSDYDHRVLDFVVKMFAHLKDVEVTLFNVYSPVPEIQDFVHEAQILDKLKKNLNQISGQIKVQEKALSEVRETLIKKGFQEDDALCIFKVRKTDTAGEIIALSRQERFDVIVVNHKQGKFTRFFTGNIFEKVIPALKDTAICVVN